MIEFRVENGKLILIYTPMNGSRWLYEKLNKGDSHTLKKTFILHQKDLFSKEVEEEFTDVFNQNLDIEFVIGVLKDKYYKINKDVLGIKQDLFISKSLLIKKELFIAQNNISIIKKISNLVNGDIYIGGDNENTLPEAEDEMNRLIDNFPNTNEIKKPSKSLIVTKKQYRDNYIPMRELSGTVMQIEKYIFHLNKWGKAGENYLTNKYRDNLPTGFEIQITNPCGIIIMGRENDLSRTQLLDFEVIKRKYKNIVDIITYDDLLNRLNFVIQQLKKS